MGLVLEVRRRFALGKLAVLVAAFMVLAGVGSAPVSADVTKEFDARLSLTGSCTVSSLDEVPDPGCPNTPHLPGSFVRPTGVAVDFYGDIYVATFGSSGTGSGGKIDVFSPSGVFLTEVLFPKGPRGLAVDSKGFLYVAGEQGQLGGTEGRIVRLNPTTYKPQSGEIDYDATPHVVEPEGQSSIFISLAVNPENDHLFANFGGQMTEYSAAETNSVVEKFSAGSGGPGGIGLAIDAERDLIYESNSTGGAEAVRILKLAAPHELVGTIEGSVVPAGKFAGQLSLAVDEETGHLFVMDEFANKLYEFDASHAFVGTEEHGFQTTTGAEIAADNGPFSPNGGENPDGRYIYVPSHPTGVGHSFAFGPPEVQCPPEVKSASVGNVSETEAELQATVNPCNLPTTYTFEYTTQARFEVEGFTGASIAGAGQLPAGNVDQLVSAAATGLSPGTEIVFRIVATNEEGSESGEGRFRTYPFLPIPACANDDVRTGFSALLADCRAYELVTPPNTNGRPPKGTGLLGAFFVTPQTSPDGSKVPFLIQGGAVPGTEGTGGASALAGDPYLAIRTSTGWSTAYTGPVGSEAPGPLPGATSVDQGYSFFATGTEGSAAIEGKATSYVRYPDGHKELIGRGSLGTDPQVRGKFISPNGGHIIFESEANPGSLPLEPNAPGQHLNPSSVMVGTTAVYDRTSDEITHVVSLLPESITPKPGEDAVYIGASLDGSGIAFSIGSTLYLRYENSETFEVGKGVTFAGIADGGSHVFYLEGGTLRRFDALSGERVAFNSTGTVTPVNISPDGSVAYLVSTSVLAKTANPNGEKAKAGKQNLYLSREGSLSFVGIVTDRDVEGEEIAGVEPIDGLGLWTTAVGANKFGNAGRLGADSSRTTVDGNVLLFESRSPLTSYDSEEHAEIYRYDFEAEELSCLSCNPVGTAASGDASLQSSIGEGGLQLLSSFALVSNLSSSGRRAFFQSPDQLVASDTDERQDVYEWEAQGIGSCTSPEGCLYLISSGQSARNDYLFAVSPSGDDAFILTADLLLPGDADETPSIYDARVGGGFPEPKEAECQGEGCRPGMTQPPSLPSGGTPALGSDDNVRPRRCPRGKHKVKRQGKTRCVKKHHKHHKHHHRANSNQKGGAK